MARTLVEAPLTTRNARAGLPIGLHWRGLDPEVHLGYRKGKRGGVWLVRWRHGTGYRQAPLGTADDSVREGNLDFTAASKAAREHVEHARATAAAEAAGPVLTVRLAVEAYISMRDERDSRREGRAVPSNAGQRLRRHVLGQPAYGSQPAIPAKPLADIVLHALTERDLQAWLGSLPEAMKVSTAKRLINDFKAALNAAAASNRDKLPTTLPATVRHGLKAAEGDDEPIARNNQILTDAQVARLVAAARKVDAERDMGGDLFRLVLVLAATGARFSQVARLCVADCQFDKARLMLPVSRKGRGKAGVIPVPLGRDVLDALAPVATGRAPDEPLLAHWQYQRGAGIRWERKARGAWNKDEVNRRFWPAIRVRAKCRGNPLRASP